MQIAAPLSWGNVPFACKLPFSKYSLAALHYSEYSLHFVRQSICVKYNFNQSFAHFLKHIHYTAGFDF